MAAIANITPELASDPRVAVAMKMFDAWSSCDWQGIEDLFAEDGVLHSMMMDPVVGRITIGRGIKAWGAGATHVQLHIKHIGLINGIVYAERVDEFVHGGHKCALPTVGALEIKNGLVQYWREYYDRGTLITGMGLSSDYAVDRAEAGKSSS